MRTRAERRHHHTRMLEKVKNFFWIKRHYSEEERLDHIRKMAENRKPCSCWMCGNPRRHSKDRKTIQEKRYDKLNYD